MRWLIGVALVAAVIIACNEQFPAELGLPSVPDAGTTSRESGLDARPTGATCKAIIAPPAKAKVGWQRLDYPALVRPVEIVRHGTRLYALEQAGVAKVLHEDGQTVTTFADLRSRIGNTGAGESGLLGIAFHPSFATNGFVYVYYTAPGGPVFDSVLSRFESKDGGLTLDLATEKKILVVAQPYGNHNGATIAFGNDGFLYWGLGDGGGAGDPQNRAQDLTSLFGKILRIDVDSGDPYAIPPSNPFIGAGGGARTEIYALGLRNPYRFRFDRVTGDLWAGDVGQATYEEIDKIVGGGNYGWRIKEGTSCFDPNPCASVSAGLIDPVVQHGRDQANAIIGGVVYRGTGMPELTGKYVYGDLGHQFFAFTPTDPAPIPLRLDEGLEMRAPSAFELDLDGEVVFTDYDDGFLYRLVAPSPPPEMPALLVATGCHELSGMFPYDVVVPQWLDGNEADRFLSLPDGATMKLGANGRYELPPGSVAARVVRSGTRKIETQLLVVRADGSKGAYSYRWSVDGREAILDAGETAECVLCHTERNFTIGLEQGQLDRDFAFPGGRTGNVLVTLGTTKMIDTIDTAPAPLVALDSSADGTARARSYLHANCSFCHDASPGPTPLDLRATTAVKDMNACGTGRFESIPVRMRSVGPGMMPPVGRTTPFPAAALATVDDFVRSTRFTCP